MIYTELRKKMHLVSAVRSVFTKSVQKSDGPISDMCRTTLAHMDRQEEIADLLSSPAQRSAKVHKSVKGGVLYNWQSGPFAHLTVGEFVAAHDGYETLQYQLHKLAGGYGNPPANYPENLEDIEKLRADDDTPPRPSPHQRSEFLSAFRALVDEMQKELHPSTGPGLSRDEIFIRVMDTPRGKAAAARIRALPAATND